MARSQSAPQPPNIPSPLDHNDFTLIESQLRELADCKHLIQRCKRCSIPVDEAEADCEALIQYFQGLLAEFRGPQSNPISG